MAKTIRDEDLRLNIIVNGDKGRKEIMESEKEIKRLTDLQKDYNAQVKAMERDGSFKTRQQGYENLKKASEQVASALKKEQEHYNSLNRQLNVNSMTMSELSKHIRLTKIALNQAVPGTEMWKKLNTELKTSRTRMKELADQSKATGGILQSLNKIKAGTVAAFTAIAGAIRSTGRAYTTIADFEQANVNLSTIIGKNISEIKQLTDSAKQLGATTEYTASQVTQLQTELAKLGFKESDILNMTKPVLQFATAVGADLGEAAAMAGSTLRIFGLQTKDTEDTLATLAVATNNSALSFSYLQTAMSIVGPVAKTFGFSVKDTTALLGTLANSGFDASSAATATRNILLKLADANGDLAKALGGPVRSFPELIKGLSTLNSQGVDLAKTLELTDKRSVAAFNAFLDGADSAMALRDSLEEVDGELGRIAEERLNTVEGSVKLLKSAWEGLILSLSNSKGPIKWVIDRLTDLLTVLARLSRQFRIMELGTAISDDIQNAYANGGTEGALEYINSQSTNLEAQANSTHWWQFKKKRVLKDARAALGQQAISFQNQLIEGAIDGVTDGSSPRSGSGSGLSGSSGKGGKTTVDPVKEAGKVLDELIKQQEDYQKKSEQLAKDGAAVIVAAEEDKTKAALINENTRYLEELKKYRDSEVAYEDKAKVIEAIEKRHQINLAKIKQDAFDKDITRLTTQNNIEKEKIRQKYTSDLALRKGNGWQDSAINKRMEEDIVQADIAYLKSLESKLKEITANGSIDGLKLDPDEVQKYKLQLEQTVNKINELTAKVKANSAGIFGGTGQGSLFGISEDQWGQFFYNLDHGKLKAEDLVNALGAIGNVASEGFKLASQAISNTNTKEQAAFREYQKNQENERKALQDRLDSGLVSQQQYNAAIEKMETEMEAKQEEMQLKQAKREKQMNLIQAIINTALGVTKTLAQWGIPAGIAPAAIMSAMGAAQIALISSQPISAGAEEGGFINTRRKQDGKSFKARLSPDKRGFINSPTILVGENGGEYVIPAEGVNNPTLLPLLNTMETARKAGKLRDLNFEAVYPVTSSFGREYGGFVRATTYPSPGQATPLSDESQRLSDAIELLVSRLQEPIKADVSMLGKNGILEQMDKYNRSKTRGSYSHD